MITSTIWKLNVTLLPSKSSLTLLIDQNELFADLNPPKVIQSFVWGNSIVTLTESFFTNNQLEVYNVETKQTSSELVMVTHPIDRKNWQLAAINRDVNVLISGFVYELDRYILQVYILRKVIKDSASGNTSNKKRFFVS